MKKRFWGWSVLLLLLSGLVACGATETTNTTNENDTMAAAATIAATIPAETGSTIAGVVELGEQDRSHDPEYQYAFSDLPPAGGIHNPIWVNCGVYTEMVPVEMAIHSLEHGSVWITYQPELDETVITTLQGLAKGQTHILVTPYPGLRSPIVLTAWARQLEVDSADDPRIPQFIATYLHGAQSPEPNVTCAEGVGTPLIIQ